jgi:hypothetical protein
VVGQQAARKQYQYRYCQLVVSIFVHIRFDKMSKNPLGHLLYADLPGGPKGFSEAVFER